MTLTAQTLTPGGQTMSLNSAASVSASGGLWMATSTCVEINGEESRRWRVRPKFDSHTAIDILISQIALQLKGLEQHGLLRVQARHRRTADGIHKLLERGPITRSVGHGLSMDRVRLPQVVQQVGLASRRDEVE